MLLDTRCVVCNRFDEDGANFFFKCKTMERVWDHLALGRERALLVSKASDREVIEAIMAMKEEQKAMCCIALWMFWAERNKIREGEQRRDPISLAHSIRVISEEWRRQER